MNLQQLKNVSDLKFCKSEQALAKLRSREATLRRELSRLQELAYETHSLPDSDIELRSIGGDIIWLKWLTDSRRKLNMELAQVLAQKETLAQQHRLANGKKTITDALCERSQVASQKVKAERALDEMVAAYLASKDFQ